MFVTSESLADIDRWAQIAFPSTFTKVKDYIKHNKLSVSKHNIVNYADLKKDAPMTRLSVIAVGKTTKHHRTVYACLEKTGPLLLISERRHLYLGPEVVPVWEEFYRACHVDPSNPQTDYCEPFNWIRPGDDEVGAARLEAFIQYMFLMRGKNDTKKVKVELFKEHFEGACRDIAEGLVLQAREAGTVDRCIRLKYRAKPAIAPVAQEAPTQSAKPTAPTQSIAPTESTAPTEPIATQASIELITSATPTQEHPLTMDHILATLKANLEAQIHTARSASRRETSHLRAQNQALELRAVRLETEREKYKADAAAAEARAKAAEAKVRAAEDDSAERKERCEERCDELRKVLEGAITRLGWMECSGSGGATGKAQENGEVGCSEFVFGKAS